MLQDRHQIFGSEKGNKKDKKEEAKQESKGDTDGKAEQTKTAVVNEPRISCSF
jgi:hypothetical protein